MGTARFHSFYQEYPPEQKDEGMDHMFRRVFVDNKQSVAYVNRTRYWYMNSESNPNKKHGLAREFRGAVRI